MNKTSGKPELYLVPTERLDSLWDRVLPYIESYVLRSFGRYENEDIKQAIKDKLFQLWIVVSEDEIKAVVMTQLYEFPKLKEVQIVMCAGKNRHEWFHLMKKIEGYARERGARKFSAVPRLGWKKDLIKDGFKETHTYLEKDL